MLCLSRNSIVCSYTTLSSTLDLSGRREIGRWFLGSVLKPFLKSGFNFAIFQASGNLPEEIDRLYSCVIGVAKNEAPSFRKIPERSSMPGALLSSIFFIILNNLSGSIFANSNFSFKFHFL